MIRNFIYKTDFFGGESRVSECFKMDAVKTFNSEVSNLYQDVVSMYFFKGNEGYRGLVSGASVSAALEG